MRISGHKTRSVFDRYKIVPPKDFLEAQRKLEDFHGQGAGDGKFGDNSGTTLHQNAAAGSVVN